MAHKYTVFISYVLIPTGDTYTQGVHCNYINSVELETDDPYINEIQINFPEVSDFKFLSSDISNGTGYTANRFHALVQLVDAELFDDEADIAPSGDAWKCLDVTDQVSGYTGILTPANLTSQVFTISLYNYNSLPDYDMNYLNYPSNEVSSENLLCFGDETYFFGNVTADIKAIAYTTDISVNLPLNEFNSTTNPTWDGMVDEQVYITEIGIYNQNKELVAIGKLNNPISKDSTIARTIVFAMDF